MATNRRFAPVGHRAICGYTSLTFYTSEAMRIAVMAAGAVGGYFGARMAAAGHDVFLIARGANLEAIKTNGLKLESVHGDLY